MLYTFSSFVAVRDGFRKAAIAARSAYRIGDPIYTPTQLVDTDEALFRRILGLTGHHTSQLDNVY